MVAAVVAEGLVRRYGTVHALSGLDLVVPAGTVCAVLGPNGAGKTTAIRVLATLTVPDAGRAAVLGHDVVRAPGLVRRSIGLAGQHAAVDDDLTGRENLRILGRMHHLGRRGAARRADELLERFDLADAADRLVKTWSGGMRRRLDLVASVVVAPPVLFLDEPTTGLDPRSRTAIWATVRDLVARGTTVLLTTQYLEEADRLADDVVVVDGGRAVATGSPDALKAAIGIRVEVVVEAGADLPAAASVLASWTDASPEVDEDGLRVGAVVVGSPVPLPEVVRRLDAAGVTALDVGVRRPTLDDVFLRLTGDPRTTGGRAA
ncbi:ATP-binding cassette domain-containing protein [Pseudonocardia humida]|uniref:ATP-binding cassette domain-containing protein n=1 Tax=Pseudonocardia humida TaxID=2800819 RepID=UPI00207CF03C|nr:ATP-binding cassette domain-containing protein [Pseudonocardia humida]